MPRVLNKRRNGVPAGAMFVGRPTVWGNPFHIGKDGTRRQVIAQYRAWLLANDELMARLSELRGKDLVCWCAPKVCHADVLIELANGTEAANDEWRMRDDE